MLPAAQVTAQQQLYPTAMVLLFLRFPSPHLSREQHRPLWPAACRGQTLSPFLALLLGCLWCHPQWDSLQLAQQHHMAQPVAAGLPQGPEGCEVTMEDLQLLHSTSPMGQDTYIQKLYIYACMDTHRDLQFWCCL